MQDVFFITRKSPRAPCSRHRRQTSGQQPFPRCRLRVDDRLHRARPGHGKSDIDLVLIHRQLPAARRESLREQGWPVEAFIHDLHTLQYFFDHVDRPSGVPSLASMVNDGRLLCGDEALAAQAKAMAQAALRRGPPPWDAAARDASRYALTDIVDDIRAPFPDFALRAALAQLLPLLANHYLRGRGLWSAKGKAIARRLAQVDPGYAARFDAAFQLAFHSGETAPLIQLAADTLQADGGWLFQSYQLTTPADWRCEPVYG